MKKLFLQNLKRKRFPSCIIFRIQRLEVNIADSDEVTHFEVPHLDLHCCQIYTFSNFALLTLKAPVMTAADDISKYFFIVFQRK